MAVNGSPILILTQARNYDEVYYIIYYRITYVNK